MMIAVVLVCISPVKSAQAQLNTQQKRCYYGADGTLQKVAIGSPAASGHIKSIEITIISLKGDDSFSDDPDEHRVVLDATARYPLLKGRVLVSNRGRVDARFIVCRT
jgi:hypothetical protein